LQFVTIYRPPSKAKSPNVAVFLMEFAELPEDLTLNLASCYRLRT